MRIVPEITPLTEPYWTGAAEGRLMIQRCGSCGARWLPPEPFCGTCQSDDLSWQQAPGDGVIYSFTVVQHPTHPAFDGKTPYLVALVDLAEGPRLVSTVRGIAFDQVEIDLPVHVAFDTQDGVTLPYFVPTS